jgi:upstream activation factor subunit UAF30
MVSDLDLVTRLREILGSSDLNTATPASVRRQLEADFGVDLTDKKAYIRDQIDTFLESNGAVEDKPESPKVEEYINADEIKAEIEGGDGEDLDGDGSGSEEEKEERPVKAKKRGGGITKVSQLSPQLEKVVGASQLGRTEVIFIFFRQLFCEAELYFSLLCCVYLSGCEENVGIYPREGFARPKG